MYIVRSPYNTPLLLAQRSTCAQHPSTPPHPPRLLFLPQFPDITTHKQISELTYPLKAKNQTTFRGEKWIPRRHMTWSPTHKKKERERERTPTWTIGTRSNKYGSSNCTTLSLAFPTNSKTHVTGVNMMKWWMNRNKKNWTLKKKGAQSTQCRSLCSHFNLLLDWKQSTHSTLDIQTHPQTPAVFKHTLNNADSHLITSFPPAAHS